MKDRMWNLKSIYNRFLTLIAVLFCSFHVYTAGFGSLSALDQRVIHWMGVFVYMFLISRKKSKPSLFIDLVLVFMTLFSGIYLMFAWRQITLIGVGQRTPLEIALAIFAVVVTIEGARRSIGMMLPITAVAFLVYVFIGKWLPPLIGHRGYSLNRIATIIYYGTEGIYGTALDVSANVIIVFIIFGSLLSVTGAGQFFIDLAFSIAGRWRGGSAKTAVISSSLMGTISGSPAANVVTTGTFTIPLMKRDGFFPYIAGAVEAVASTGGQIMPPVMGAAAFVMAEFLGLPYLRIVLAALIPAILYYVSCYLVIDIIAVKYNIKGRSPEELPSLTQTLKSGWGFLIPLGVLIYGISSGISVNKSVFNSIVVLFIILFIKERFNIKSVFSKFIRGCEDALQSSFSVVSACACAGMVVGVIQLTGLGLRVSSLITSLAGNSLLLALVLCMVAALILGMGLPTTVLYIVLSTLAAPSLVSLGLPPLVAHMFVFYFGCISSITPPVALAAYAAAGIAQSDITKTGLYAFKLGISAYIIPFLFVYNPELLLIGSPWGILREALIGLIVVIVLSYGAEGWLFQKTGLLTRLLLLVSPALMVSQSYRLWGIFLVALALIIQYYKHRYLKAN